MIIARAIVGDPLRLKSTIVHEFFHALQDAHNSALYEVVFSEELTTTYWFVEASASWAELHFVPEAAKTQVYSPWFTNDFQSNDGPLNQPNDEEGNQAYRSFIWSYFMQQETGGADSPIVAQAWTQLEGAATYADADKALNRLFSFDEYFADCAFRNINERLVPNNAIKPLWSGLDPNFPVAGLTGDSPVKPPVPGGKRVEGNEYVDVTPEPTTVDYDETLKPLTSHYRHFTIANEVEAVSIDLSQLDGGDVIASALVHVSANGTDEWQRRDIAPGRTTWCLGDPANYIDQFTLVISNASYKEGDNTEGHYSVTGRATCAQIHGTIEWTDHVTHTDGFGTGHGTTTIWLDVALKEVGPGTFIDDTSGCSAPPSPAPTLSSSPRLPPCNRSSYSVHGIYNAPDQPAPSIYDCATVNSFQTLFGTGTFISPGNYSGTGQLSLVINYPTTGTAQLTAFVSGKGHIHSELVGPSSCAGVDDSSSVGPYTPTVIWCKGLSAEVSGQQSTSGAISGDGRSIDMTCADSRTVNGGTQGNVTVTTVDQVTVAGTLYIKPTDQATP